VLVVDDSSPIRELISVNLVLEDFDVRTAVDGQEALDRLAEWQPDWLPDVVTLDVMMPRLDGFETLRRLRADARFAHLPVVLVTGRAQAADQERGLELGVDAYITKPFEPSDLVTVVRGLATGGRAAC
jgi:CheY-like chemotaxis protein